MKKLLIIIGVALLCISPFLGTLDLTIHSILNEEIANKIFFDVRVPRTILAFLTGGILALSGLLFQGIFRNPLTTPFTLGVASGATLGSAFAIVFSLSSFIFFFGFLGAMFTVTILFALSMRLKKFETNALLLIGIALSFFYSSALLVLYYISDFQQSYEIVRFTMGSLAIVGNRDLIPVALSFLALILVAHFYKREIKLLLTSYDYAYMKGIDIKKVVLTIFIFVSLAVGIVVSISGPIGFVGLIIPHVVKMIYKKSMEKLFLETAFFGGIFMTLCDIIARSLPTLSEVPIGVVTSFVGGPFFIYLIWKRRQ